MMDVMKRGRFALGAAIALLLLAAAPSAHAVEMDDLIGDWNTLVYAPDAPQLADLEVEEGDSGGLVAISRSALGEVEITDVTQQDDGKFKLAYWVVFNGVNSDIVLTIDLGETPGDTLTGNVAMNQGALKFDFIGAKKGTEAEKKMLAEFEAAKAKAAAAHAPAAAAAPAAGAASTETAAAEAAAAGESAPASDVKLEDLVGKWVVLVLLPEGPQKANIDVKGDANGLTATLVSPLGESQIDDIDVENGEHVMTYMMDLGGQPMDIQVTARVTGDKLAGMILVNGGAMELNIEGAREGTEAAAELEAKAAAAAPPAAAPAAGGTEAAPAQAESQPAAGEEKPAEKSVESGPTASSQEGPDRGVAELVLSVKKVSIDYGRPSTAGAGYKQMASGVPDGFVWRLGKNQATRLTTDVDLKFGETVIKAGEYGLWARRQGDHWDLIFNSNAKAWGIPYRADGEIATVPMTSAKTDEIADLLTINFEPQGKGGVIHVHWGNEIGSVTFEVAN